ncbi:MAG: beta-ketoacyl-ACP synthase III [Pseudomonadota bacterium]
MFSRIIGTGHSFPKTCVSNAELSTFVDTTDEWITDRTGIRQRYRVNAEETTSLLATQAAQQALSHSSTLIESIDLIIVATTTPDQAFPSTACFVQAQLGNTHAAAFDIQAVCSGFVYALTVADQFIRSGQAKKALVIGAETMTRLLDWSDRSTCVLFGDGAGAVILEACSRPGILGTKLFADGTHAKALYARGPNAYPITDANPYLQMDGRSVFRFAVNAMSQAVESLLKEQELNIDDIDWVIPHQANQRILDAVADRLNLSKERVISTVAQHANTSAASIPLALSEAVKKNQFKPGQKIVLVSMGAGFTWGSVVLEWQQIP